MDNTDGLKKTAADNTEMQEKLREWIKHLATPEGKAELKTWMKQHVAEHSGKDGYCSDDDCKGLIVKQVRGLCSFGYTYDIPCCSKCGRQYIFAEGNIPAVGHKEFEELMNKPFTI